MMIYETPTRFMKLLIVTATFFLVLSGSTGLSRAAAVHHWTFDGHADDVIGGKSGTVHGASLVPGRFGQAYAFDGNDYISTDYTPQLDADGSFTMMLWVLLPPGPITQEQYLLGLERSYCHEVALKAYPTGLGVKYRSDEWTGVLLLDNSFNVSDGQWHHLAGVLDRAVGQVRVYIDGQLTASIDQAIPGTFNIAYPRTMEFGADNNSDIAHYRPFTGLLDEIQFFESALSGEQVRQEMAAAIPEPATLIAGLAGLAGVGRYLRQRATR